MSSPYAQATSLSIAPLSYEAELKPPEKKKGFVDIANQSKESQTIHLEVQVFRQVDDLGTLKFYPDTQTSAGVQLDHDKIELAPKEGMRVYFLLDSDKLPKGDVFAAILASTIPKATQGAAQSVRVGTLLLINNGKKVDHKALISEFDAPWLQYGKGLEATIRLKNPADEKTNSGFMPQVSFAAQPYGVKNVKGPLLFASRSRSVDYRQDGNYFGPMYIKASTNDSSRGAWVLAITGFWTWVVPIVAAIIAVMGVIWWRLHRPKTSKKESRGLSVGHRR